MEPGTCVGVLSAIGARAPIKQQVQVRYEEGRSEIYDIIGWAIDEDGHGHPLALMPNGMLVPVPLDDDDWKIQSGDAVIPYKG